MNKPPQHELISLLEHYQSGKNDKTEKLALSMTQKFPKNQFGWKILGAVLRQAGRKIEALNAIQKSIELSPKDFEAHNNLGLTLRDLGRLEEAEVSLKKAIALKSDFYAAHSNLGIILVAMNRFEEAEVSLKKAIALKSDFYEGHNKLSIILAAMNRFEEAEKSCRQAIVLKPDYTEGHNNLGLILKELSKFEEAEASFRHAIMLKPDYAEAYNNLGITIAELGKFEEAEKSCRQAISLEPDYAEAHSNLGIILYGNGDIDSAIISIEKANLIDPKSSTYNLFLSILQARKVRHNAEIRIGNINNSDSNLELPRKIFISNKSVEEELLAYLYKIKLIDLEKENDPSFGNARGSKYELFDDDHPIIKTLEEELTKIMMEAVKSEIYIFASFFSIFGAGGGTKRHNHINSKDKVSILNLAKQKYSLVYYLSVGDQECKEPGFLKLYEPSEDILPNEGLITIFPADRQHSSFYGGNKDRVIVGVNFYSI